MRVVAIAGTSRPDNFTHRAVVVLARALEARAAEVEVIDGRALTLGFPGHPETDDARRLQAELGDECAGVVLATPEYHGSFSAFLKLTLENLGFPSPLKGKPVALLGVAAGRIGAIKSLEQLRSVCAHMGAHVLPSALSIAGVNRKFDDDGNCIDEGTQKGIDRMADAFVDFVGDRHAPGACAEEEART